MKNKNPIRPFDMPCQPESVSTAFHPEQDAPCKKQGRDLPDATLKHPDTTQSLKSDKPGDGLFFGLWPRQRDKFHFPVDISYFCEDVSLMELLGGSADEEPPFDPDIVYDAPDTEMPCSPQSGSTASHPEQDAPCKKQGCALPDVAPARPDSIKSLMPFFKEEEQVEPLSGFAATESPFVPSVVRNLPSPDYWRYFKRAMMKVKDDVEREAEEESWQNDTKEYSFSEKGQEQPAHQAEEKDALLAEEEYVKWADEQLEIETAANMAADEMAEKLKAEGLLTSPAFWKWFEWKMKAIAANAKANELAANFLSDKE